MEGDEKEFEDTDHELEMLSTKLDDKMVVSLDEVNWEEAGNNLKWAVLAKLASGKPIRKDSLVDVFRKVWRLLQDSEFFKVEKNLMLVKLGNKEDHDKVMEGGPWIVEGKVILLQKWEVAGYDRQRFC